ncbi:MAG: hypothetical protein BJ554DRAFT_7535 [Olpidium bornovanus]|uniref:Uncharacterized protein n=1 Tax=Olpidium bornovanus TaxID=278681 RepID=A0A8H8DJ15_9FUNG|nr:MAG: hypothetical protein BJ554DRAFT_7535 [Olpidium bornovanus]
MADTVIPPEKSPGGWAPRAHLWLTSPVKSWLLARGVTWFCENIPRETFCERKERREDGRFVTPGQFANASEPQRLLVSSFPPPTAIKMGLGATFRHSPRPLTMVPASVVITSGWRGVHKGGATCSRAPR